MKVAVLTLLMVQEATQETSTINIGSSLTSMANVKLASHTYTVTIENVQRHATRLVSDLKKLIISRTSKNSRSSLTRIST